MTEQHIMDYKECFGTRAFVSLLLMLGNYRTQFNKLELYRLYIVLFGDFRMFFHRGLKKRKDHNRNVKGASQNKIFYSFILAIVNVGI